MGIIDRTHEIGFAQFGFVLMREDLGQWFSSAGQLVDRDGAAVRGRRASLARTEQRIAALIRVLADGDNSEYVVTALRDFARAGAHGKGGSCRTRSAWRPPNFLAYACGGRGACGRAKTLIQRASACAKRYGAISSTVASSSRPSPRATMLRMVDSFHRSLSSIRHWTWPPRRGPQSSRCFGGCAGATTRGQLESRCRSR